MEITTQPPAQKGVVKNPQTIGQHLRNRRIQTQLIQKDVANIIGVSEDSLTYWENGRTEPQIQFMPKIIEFLGYMPMDINTSMLEGRVWAYRLYHGLSHKKMGLLLGVDGSTIRSWENGKCLPSLKMKDKIETLLPINPTGRKKNSR